MPMTLQQTAGKTTSLEIDEWVGEREGGRQAGREAGRQGEVKCQCSWEFAEVGGNVRCPEIQHDTVHDAETRSPSLLTQADHFWRLENASQR